MLGNIEGANAAREQELLDARVKRTLERVSAAKANRTDYKLSPDSIAALERGDRQRETGLYEGHRLESSTCGGCGEHHVDCVCDDILAEQRLADDGGPHV